MDLLNMFRQHNRYMTMYLDTDQQYKTNKIRNYFELYKIVLGTCYKMSDHQMADKIHIRKPNN